MAKSDAVFSGTIAEFYDRYIGPTFAPWAADIVRRLNGFSSGSLLEVAAGTGMVTEALARALPAGVAITATDLNHGMIDYGARKPGMGRVAWRQADAMALPFADACFNAVVCQFGVMFFPDRVRAYAEARRVLRPGGRSIFNVWDSLEHNQWVRIAEKTVARLFPGAPTGFLGRVPFAYHDPNRIRNDLRAAGFQTCKIEPVAATFRATARDLAIGVCQGTPLRAEIEAADPNALGRATDAVAAALAVVFGDGPAVVSMRALVVETLR